LHVPWGASLFHLKHHFAVIIVVDFTWCHCVLNNIEEVMIPCLCTFYFISNRIFCAQALGSFLIIFRASFWSYHNIFTQFFLWIILLLSSFVGSLSIMLFCLQSFDPQYSLISSNFCLWICDMCFHFFWGLAHHEEELSLYWPSKPFCPFWQWMPMGEKFRGFEGNWVSCFCFVLKHLSCMLCMVEYI
jgi:hypothetical protein